MVQMSEYSTLSTVSSDGTGFSFLMQSGVGRASRKSGNAKIKPCFFLSCSSVSKASP